jgi:probable HAF family extracellular repeat protein
VSLEIIRTQHLGAIALASSCCAACSLDAAPTYTLLLIELAEGDFSNVATAVNDAGQVAGYSNAPSGNHAWRWTEGVLEDLGDVGGVVMRARAINELGHVAGYGNDDRGVWIGWTWDGALLDPIDPLGGLGSRAWGINDVGLTVGDGQIPSAVWNALSWDGAVSTNLGTLGGANSQAYAVNNSDRVAGFATNADVDARAVVWIDGILTEFEQPPAHSNSVAYGINDGGVAVGTVGDGFNVVVPARWDGNGVQELPQLPGAGVKSYAWSVNEPGQIVGWTEIAFGETVATAWIDGAVHNLNDLVTTEFEITLTQAWDVNNTGVIVGVGSLKAQLRAWILTPVLIGDLNGDGEVGFADLSSLLAAWGPCPPAPPCPADLDRDGAVAFADLSELLARWGISS